LNEEKNSANAEAIFVFFQLIFCDDIYYLMNYDLTLKPNRKRLVKLTIICVIMLLAGIIGFIIAAYTGDQYVSYSYVKKGLTGEIRRIASGWPAYLRTASIYVIAIGGVSAAINIVNMLRAKTAFALNKDGMMITLKGMAKPVFVEWKDIESLQEINNKHGKGVVLRHSVDQLIEKYGGKRKRYSGFHCYNPPPIR